MCQSVALAAVHLSSVCLQDNKRNAMRLYRAASELTLPAEIHFYVDFNISQLKVKANVQSQLYSLSLRLACCWMSHCVGCRRTLASVAADGCHGNLGLHILPGIPTQWNTRSLTSWMRARWWAHKQTLVCVSTHTTLKGGFKYSGVQRWFISRQLFM